MIHFLLNDSSLPIFEARDHILKQLKIKNVLIIIGDTGSGKSTQVPRFLLNEYIEPHSKIACTQPRRLAAMSLAKRVSQEIEKSTGSLVGFSVRFERCVSKHTKIIYLTEGILLRELASDPLLSVFTTIIIDEAHERTLFTDLLLGIFKEIIKLRKYLKVIIMSATLEVNKFFNYFWNTVSILVPGRLFEVELLYAKHAEKNYLRTSIMLIFNIQRSFFGGDILLFLTGEDDIEEFCLIMTKLLKLYKKNIRVYPLYSNLSSEYQEELFQLHKNNSKDKDVYFNVIASTNIAESSITLDGISFVIDGGFSKIKIFNPRLKIDSLLIYPISKASAHQRSGRAGRTKPGKCFRLYTENCFNFKLADQLCPEILRTNLHNMILIIKKIGIEDLVHFDFIDPPPPETIMRALELLNLLGALNSNGLLTKIGLVMSEIPIEPQSTKAIIESKKYRCCNEIISIIAMLSSNFTMRSSSTINIEKGWKSGIIHKDGDHLTILNIYHLWRSKCKSKIWASKNGMNYKLLEFVDKLRIKLINLCYRLGVKLISEFEDNRNYFSKIRKAIFSGYFLQTARKLTEKMYITDLDHHSVLIHPSCKVYKSYRCVMYNSLFFSTALFMCIVTKVNDSWMKNYYNKD